VAVAATGDTHDPAPDAGDATTMQAGTRPHSTTGQHGELPSALQLHASRRGLVPEDAETNAHTVDRDVDPIVFGHQHHVVTVVEILRAFADPFHHDDGHHRLSFRVQVSNGDSTFHIGDDALSAAAVDMDL
jgi:hypothetical protein